VEPGRDGNAVIGKAHRLGLQSRPSPVKANEAEQPVAAAPSEAAETQAPKTRPAPEPRPAPKAEPQPRASEPAAEPAETKRETKTPQPQVRSIGPGGFIRQGPSDQQAPIPPAPPRRLVPAKPSPEIADKTSLLDLNERVCKWPIGHPGEPDFHFCGRQSNPGFPYCVEHCGVAYQAQLPRRDRKPPPPLPFGGPRVR
jgi:GcrA cell cycle regulator